MDYIKLNKSAFDILSESYKKRRVAANKKHFEIITESFADYILTSFSAPSLLEIGSGAGIYLNLFEKKGIKTAAIDISLEMIKIASEFSPKREYINDDFLKHDFHGRIFQGVFARQVFHLFPKIKSGEFLNKVYFLLAKKGLFYLSIPLYNESQEGYETRGLNGMLFKEFRVRYTEDEFINIINHSNFAIKQKNMYRFKDTTGGLVSGLEVLLKKC